MIIAIDGPSGAGKSTVSKLVATELGFCCLDTGAMFRSVAWLALEQGISLEDGERLGQLAASSPISFVHEAHDPSPKQVFISGVDVTGEIRTARIDKSVSKVSCHPQVRSALLDQQRRIAQSGDYVIEGRDIGTVVFPDAQVKVFLTASNQERARRRVEQTRARGIGSVDFEEVLADIIKRDEADSKRDAAPLRPAEDAFMLDSSHMTTEEVVSTICDLARSKG